MTAASLFIINKPNVIRWWVIFVIASARCGEGSRPVAKLELSAWRVECELGLIADAGCPVDGGWGAWSAWGPCRGACGAPGRRQRARRCDRPPPAADGLPCAGPSTQAEPCFQTNCTVDHFRTLVRGDPARARALPVLLAVPALAARCLRTDCGYEAVRAALVADRTWQFEPEAFWNALLCVKHNLGCEVAGGWGGWGAWDTCGARCGAGQRWRTRRCDAPPPSSARVLCAGAPLQAAPCYGEACASGVGSAHWGNWSRWSPCSERCGPGAKRRRRACVEEPASPLVARWGTHCVGQCEEYEVCENAECSLDGGWSGWAAWGACSRGCGAGRRLRVRSCSRPQRAGRGRACAGPHAEPGACYLAPCDAYTHVVAVLNGDSYLHYNLEKKRSALFHFYIRFLPLSPHGSLVRRGGVRSPHVRLSLQRWHACVDARGPACAAPRVCSPAALEPAVWHSALLTVSNDAATLRLDDAPDPLRASFPCEPELPIANMNILVGERLRGEIQEMALNFIPLNLVMQNEQQLSQDDFSPASVVEVSYGKASLEEAYLPLHDGLYVRVPCFDDQDEWKLELTVKPQTDSGIILFLKSDAGDNWLHVALQYMRLKIKLVMGEFWTESISVAEYPPEQWLDVVLTKKKTITAIEALLNEAERLHAVLFEARETRSTRGLHNKLTFRSNRTTCDEAEGLDSQHKPVFSICDEEFFVGGVPAEISENIPDDLPPLSGVIASMTINNVMQDLHSFNVERSKQGQVQLSSRSASVSGSYHEAAWGSSNRLRLTCLHARSARSPHAAQWVYLDTTITNIMKRKSVRAVDDGQVLKLDATADKDLRGFYTCRARTGKGTRNLVTYGVTGKLQYKLAQPDRTTALVVVTTVLLVIATLGWLVFEGVHDLRMGFGFFRDAHLTPEQEAEAVCSYIDDHAHLIGSDRAVRLAKARARYRAKQLAWASKASFAAQEPQGLIQVENHAVEPLSDGSGSLSDLGGLPQLPTSTRGLTHDVFKCEPGYVSSPRHGTVTSPRSRLSSLGSSPRLLVPKKIYSSRRSLWFRKHRRPFNGHFDVSSTLPALPTIQSATFSELTLSPAQKILKKFQQLQCDD